MNVTVLPDGGSRGNSFHVLGVLNKELARHREKAARPAHL